MGKLLGRRSVGAGIRWYVESEVGRSSGQWSMSMGWPSALLVLTRTVWVRLAPFSRLNSSIGENNRRIGELLLVGFRLAGGVGRSTHASRLEFAWARWKLSAAPWSGEAPGKGGEWRGVAMEAASNAGGASGASGDGHEFSLAWPLGSKFAAAMLM